MIRLIRQIPDYLIEEFLQSCVPRPTQSFYRKDIKKSSVNVGAFDGENIIGFTCGGNSGYDPGIIMHGIYVKPEYQMTGKGNTAGVGQRLLTKLIMEAGKQGLNLIGSDLNNRSYRMISKIVARIGAKKAENRPFEIGLGKVSMTSLMAAANIRKPARKPK